MDDDKKKIAELTKQLADATVLMTASAAETKKLQADLKAVADSNKKLGDDLKAKDKVIETQKGQIIGQRRKFSERTKEELDEMTDAEKEALKLAEDTADDTKKRLDKIEADSKAATERERQSRIDAAIGKYTNKPDLQEAIKKNLARLSDFAGALTVQEIEKGVTDAITLLGNAAPDALRAAVSSAGSGEAPGDSNAKDHKSFADSEKGQDLLKKIMPQAAGALTPEQKAAESKMSGARAPTA
jgi:hypothetical protein